MPWHAAASGLLDVIQKVFLRPSALGKGCDGVPIGIPQHVLCTALQPYRNRIAPVGKGALHRK